MLGILFAQANTEIVNRLEETGSDHRFTTTDLLIVVSAALVVGLALLIWAVFLRKRRDEHDHPDPHRTESIVEAPSSSGHHGRRKHKRRRRRRRDHRPRNPTLSQTGGLPSPRPEDQPPPY